MVKNEDCAMFVGWRIQWCNGWDFTTCEGCRYAKLKSDGWYKNDVLGRVGFIERKEDKD